MAWYSAYTVVSTRFQNTPQDYFPIWENVILIEADSEDEATEKAKLLCTSFEDTELALDGKPAFQKLEGLRKIVKIDGDVLQNGTELGNSLYQFGSKDELERFFKLEAIDFTYIQ